MVPRVFVANQILEVIACYPGCDVEKIGRRCPSLTWNQIFLEVDRLSRNGPVRLTRKGAGIYFLNPELPLGHAQVHSNTLN